MRIDTTFLRSKVAHRIFLLFIICAIVPMTSLAIISFIQVASQLEDQSLTQIHQDVMVKWMSIYDRLLSVEAEMKALSSHILRDYETKKDTPPRQLYSRQMYNQLLQRFRSLSIIKGDRVMPLVGHIEKIPPLRAGQRQHMSSGKPLIFTQNYPDQTTSIFMGIQIDSEHSGQGLLIAEIKPSYLWGIDREIFPETTKLCILDQSNHVLFSSLPSCLTPSLIKALSSMHPSSTNFEWTDGTTQYLASSSYVFLKERFFEPTWTLVMSETKTHAKAPIANFKKTFILVFIMSIFTILFLSISQIRKTLVPLDKLRESTQRIAKGDFGSRVTVKSGDEFEDLATSFNSMTLQIDKQFKELAAMANIDCSILSVLNVEKIVETFFSHIGDIFPCDSAGACLLNTMNNTWHNYIRPSSCESSVRKETINLCPEEIQTLYDNPKYLLMYLYEGLPRYLHYFIQQGMESFLVMPIFLDKRLSAIITLAHKKTHEYSQESLAHARQLSDRMAVALSNTHLIEELNQFNIGTLTALARIVDAKSPWTAGHSERVAEIGTRIGREIGLPQPELDVLTKAGLLHDIGKISIPSKILNKPWKLTKEEFRVIQEHPLTGVRILKPIIPYAETIPIVLQHHERFDGKGYPDGICGENIVLGARILALADTFDAMTSDRPYRKGMKVEKVIEVIKAESGRQFDPKLVQAFLKIISEENKEEEGKEGYK